jgi:hypothetical protein
MKKHSPEVIERAVRMVSEAASEYGSHCGAVHAMVKPATISGSECCMHATKWRV